MAKTGVSVLITDLDNTLFDWFEFWYQSFSAMLDRLVKDSGIERERLISEIKTVHERYGTSEYAFLLEELPSIKKQHPNANIVDIYDEAIHAYRKARIEHLHLYPGVMGTLKTLKDRGCLIVGYTESMSFYTNDRVRRLDLDGVVDFIYSPADHDLPKGMSPEQIRWYSADHYQLKYTEHKHTPKGELKPNPQLLLDIVQDIDALAEEVVYVGDSLMKDVAMAQQAGVIDVHARYGTAHEKEEYELLRQVTHWPSEHVENEKRLDERTIHPSHVLEAGFSELLAIFNFLPYRGKQARIPAHQIPHIIEIWKKTVAVQQHFNDLEMRIRNYAITVLGVLLGAAGFAIKEKVFVKVLDADINIAVFIILVAIIIWFSFWFMDQHWYHRLLYGSVRHGMKIENALRRELPEIALTDSIGKESPLIICNREIHSRHKMYGFYFIIGSILLTFLMLLLSPKIGIGAGVILFVGLLVAFLRIPKIKGS